MEVPERYARCKRKLNNLWQSREERMEKYDLARSLGFSSYMAMRMRDWRPEYILHAAAMRDASVRIALEKELKREIASADS